MKTIQVSAEKYDWSIEQCTDCDEFAVMLDLGNGRPECIGYATDEQDAKQMVIEEIETFTA